MLAHLKTFPPDVFKDVLSNVKHCANDAFKRCYRPTLERTPACIFTVAAPLVKTFPGSDILSDGVRFRGG